MTSVVFVVGSFHPNFSAVGYCAYQVQKCLTDTFAVSTIAFQDNPSQPLDEHLEAIRVHRVETSDMRARRLVRAAKGKMAWAGLIALRLKGALRRLFSPETIDRHLIQAYLKCLNAMDPQPDVIVPVVFPFETVLAALAYKQVNPRVMVVPYLFDDFVNSSGLHVLKLARSLKRKRHIRLENQMLENADAVLSMYPLQTHFERYVLPHLREKITYLEHPLLTPLSDVPLRRPDDGVIRLCYTGALIHNYVEPGYLLDLLRTVRMTTPIQADFYVMGNASEMVRTEMPNSMMRIVNHGRVTKDEAILAIRNSDILLNLGEVEGKQISSKIFEYMATGKPIIHLACVENDAVTEILSKYPLALCLIKNRGQLVENARKVSEFIDREAAEELTFEQVKALYPEALPSTTASLLRDLIVADSSSLGSDKTKFQEG